MNKTELKKILKPLIKQCIKEVIFEEGVLSSLISEVVQGVSAQPIVESKKSKPIKRKKSEAIDRNLQETKRKMMEAVAADGYNGVDLFEGTKPLSGGSSTPGSSPLSGIAPDDAGVDITGIMKIAGGNWTRMV